MPRVVVAGLRGGTGKTTLSLGLLAAFRGRGLRVAPFKKGPDYIDAGWLAAAAGSPCHNLDPFLIGEDQVLGSFMEHAAGSGCAVIEGNRGLFDGMDAEGRASTARVARLLGAPVLLVLDCTKATRTLAALVLGAQRFERGLRIGGVVLNRVAGARHEAVVRASIEQYTAVPVLGALPRLRKEEMPERHMGLVPREEHGGVSDVVRRAAAAVERHVDLTGVLALAGSAPVLRGGGREHVAEEDKTGPRIGVIRDSAFQFYYPENLEELTRRGARVVELSALRAKHLPELEALYIGGGFPETHAIALARNRPLLRSIREAVEAGLPVYAECGGLMYLGQALVLGGRRHEMAGVFPVTFTLHSRPQAHGYTVVKVTRKNPYYPRGTVLRGHEFHYSRLEGDVPGSSLAFRMDRGTGIQGGRDGLVHKNVLGTYTHVHALGAPEWAEGMLRAARAHGRKAAR